MARWHRDEAQENRLRHASEGAKSGDKGFGGGRGCNRTDTAVVDCRNERIGRVARYRFDWSLNSSSFCLFVVGLFNGGGARQRQC